MKIGIIIPHRNNRPKLLQNCFRMIDAQTIQPTIVELINDQPITTEKDITWRYRMGYDRMRNKDLDVLFLMEDDDWYAPNYLEEMIKWWEYYGRPDIFGTRYTIYYHMYLKKYFTMHHVDRASAMNTMLKPDFLFDWCPDNEPYTDLHLWKVMKGLTYTPEKHISMGIKHGIGLSGGMNHTDRLHRYIETLDIKSIMDPESFDFYDKYFENNPDDYAFVTQEIQRNLIQR